MLYHIYVLVYNFIGVYSSAILFLYVYYCVLHLLVYLYIVSSLVVIYCLFFFFSCIFCVMSILFFFFFKHKTAYEFLISDWSSDVCSSDLCWWPFLPLLRQTRLFLQVRGPITPLEEIFLRSECWVPGTSGLPVR